VHQLRRAGFVLDWQRVETEAEYRAALAHEPDVILADYSLPRFDAMRALAILREHGADIPFIIVSGSIGEERAVAAMREGATDYLLKDRPARIGPAVQAALDQRGWGRAVWAVGGAPPAAETETARLLRREQIARREAEEANRAKDDFLARISHELRTPLTPLLAYTQLLRKTPLSKENTNNALAVMEQGARALKQLIDDLLDVARSESETLILTRQPLDLCAVAAGSIDLLRPSAQEKGVQLVTEFSASCPVILGDTARLQQVVGNLLANAIKFTPSGGRVTVAVSESQNHLRLEVRDTGRGISRGFLPRVFESFRQEDRESLGSQAGLGLGLAIVRHLVEAHGGTVTAASEGPDRGSSFAVLLPLAAPGQMSRHELPPPRAATEPAGQLAGLRVLLVEDDTATREVLTLVLTGEGVSVRAVATAGAALAAVEAEQPDVLISDLGLPDLDGCALLEQLQTRCGRALDFAAVALTAFAGAGDRERTRAAGYQHHVAKPVAPDELISLLAQLRR
jgi:signal transduction histidine kinase